MSCLTTSSKSQHIHGNRPRFNARLIMWNVPFCLISCSLRIGKKEGHISGVPSASEPVSLVRLATDFFSCFANRDSNDAVCGLKVMFRRVFVRQWLLPHNDLV